MKKFIVIICCFITVFLSSAPQKNKKVITFKADIASYQEVKAKNVFKGQGNAYLEIDNYKIYCEEIEIHFFKDNSGEEQIEKALFNKTIRIFNDEEQVQIGGEEAEYYREEKKFVIRNNAFYTDSKEEVAVFGDTIYNYDEEKVTIIQGNSRIYQKLSLISARHTQRPQTRMARTYHLWVAPL